MPSASALRLQIEHSLEARFPAALSPAPRVHRDMASTGIEEVDQLLEGGFPLGAISEVTGPASSGRTSLALAFLARRTAEERVCAWVDVHDSLDPESAAANGLDLRRLLWVRCRDAGVTLPASRQRPWTRLDQALRVTDLLLQAAGFACIVLDLGDTAPEHGNRIPLATWFRFRQAADRTRCTLLVLGHARYARSSAALAVECSPLEAEDLGGKVLRSFSYSIERGRQRFTAISGNMRKPPKSTWTAASVWESERHA